MNLQLFAVASYHQMLTDSGAGGGSKKKKTTAKTTSKYDPNSVVDYLKQQGQDSSYSARKQLAKDLGIKNYEGSGPQNTQMLNTLKNGGTQKPTATPVATPTTPTAKPTAEPVVKNTADPVVANPTAPAVANPTAPATGNISGVGADTMQALTTPWSMPPAIQEAWDYTNSMLEKLTSGRTSYTDQIRDMMGQIQNRDKFSYDVNSDPLFQQALASAMGSGKQAMQDTMGQASALTGGYGSTYAQSVGNQAYNAYIQDAYNNLPEYYQMALEAYNMEGQDMYNQLGMLSDADATEYGRMYDSWNASFTNAQNMYNQSYGEWQDSVNNAYNVANLQNSDYWSGMDNTYRYDALAQDQSQFDVNNTYRYDALEQEQGQFDTNTYWNNHWAGIDNTYRYDAMRNDNNQSALDRQQDDKWNQKEYDYKYSALTQDQSQFNARYDVNGDGKVDANDQAVEGSADETLKEPTETQKQKALKAFNEGGEEAYYQYIDSLPSNIDVEVIDLYVNGDGAETSGYGALPVEQRTFTKTKDTTNGLWGIDNNDIVVDQYGNEYRIDALPESLRKALTKLKNGESYTAK